MTDQALQAPTPEPVAVPSEPAEVLDTGATDTPEVVETDEQKNERVQAETRERAEKRARGVQKRLDELTADKYAERQRAERAEQRLQQIEAERQQRQAPQPQNDGEPDQSKYDDYGKYLRDVARWEARQEAAQAAAQARQQWEAERQQETTAREVAATLHTFEQRREAFAKATPDYDDVVESLSDVPMGPQNAAMVRTIMRRADSAELLYHMGKNPALAQQISRMHPEDQIAAVAELGIAIRSKAPQASKAPPPGKAVGSKPGSASEPPEDPDAYMEWRKKNLR
jgi:DNA primase